MIEYIERGAALHELSTAPFWDDVSEAERGVARAKARYVLNAIPAADVERVVRGEWKESFTTRDCQCAPSGVSYTFWYTCSNCGKKSRTKRERCLHCFAHMERSGSGE